MKKAVLVVTTLIVLIFVNFLIFKKEETLTKGRTMLLRLAPVDPRSLMQGDYMILRYAIATEVLESQLEDKGYIVVSLDENHVAKFVRIYKAEDVKVYKGEDLLNGEHLLSYRNRGGLRIGAESFMFQEGDASLYSKAKYGELKVDKLGQSVLVGLCGEDFKTLGK